MAVICNSIVKERVSLSPGDAADADVQRVLFCFFFGRGGGAVVGG